MVQPWRPRPRRAWHRPDGESWFDWYVPRLAKEVDLVPCFSYTPPSLGVVPRTSSPPREPSRYAGFVAQMTERYSEHFEWVELWNEPNNRAEWDWTLDPEYRIFSAMVIEAAERAHERGKKVLLGGLSPIDPTFLAHLGKLGVLQHMDAVGLHGFPGTWERNWNGWAAEVERIVEVNEQFGVKPALWGTEIGFSTRKSRETEQVAVFMEAVEQPFDRLYWYTLEDLHPDLAANSGFHQDEREYHQGIIRVNGLPKLLHRLWREIGVEGIKRERWIVEEPTFAPGERPVVVTGGAGFVGTNLADRLLLEGQSVLIFDDLSRQGTLRNLRWLRARHGPRAKIQVASVLQERALAAAVARASAVFHLAAQVAVTTSLEHPDHDFAVNVQGTLNLLEAMRGLENPPPLVFSSTNKVYGDLAHVDMRIKGDRYVPEDPFIATRGIDESAPLRLYTPYGCSKGAAEQYILDYARMFNLPAVVFRMSCIYGPHQHGTEDQGWIAHFLIQAAD
jgi:CDP-paratose 2-epimerase